MAAKKVGWKIARWAKDHPVEATVFFLSPLVIVLVVIMIAIWPLLILIMAQGAHEASAQNCAPPAAVVQPATGGTTLAGTLPALQLGYARTIIGVAKGLGVSERGQIVAIATALQESGIKNYANSNIPSSLVIPHDAVGSDHLSVGIFQQQAGSGFSWGSVQQLMTPEYAAGAFLHALLRVPGWEAMPVAVAAQTVQVSAFPDAYAKWEALATAVVVANQDATAVSTTATGSNTTGAQADAVPGATCTQDNPVVPMPDLATALKDPIQAKVIKAAQKIAGLTPGSTQTNPMMQLLLSMAWVDSEWGSKPQANPILSGTYTGIILKDPALWAKSTFLKAADPNDVNNADAVMQEVVHDMGGFTAQNMPAPVYWNGLLTSFYTQTASGTAPPKVTPTTLFQNAKRHIWWKDPLFRTYSDIHEWPGYCIGNLGQECGVDYAMPVGTPIGALTNGKVVNMEDNRPSSLGFEIQVVGADNHAWLYEHMFTSVVKVGDTVTVGQILGNSGGMTQSMQTDFYSSGPHIEVRYAAVYNPSPALAGPLWGQNYIDPRPFIAAAAAGLVTVDGVPAHVALILTVNQMGFGALSGGRGKIVTLAQLMVGVQCCGVPPKCWQPPVSGPQNPPSCFNTATSPVNYWSFNNPSGSPEWCAFFTSWLWQQAGIKIPTTGPAAGMGTWAQANTVFKAGGNVTPLPGDVLVWGSPAAPTGAHVSVVVAADSPTHVHTIDGNFFVGGISEVYDHGYYNPNAQSGGWFVYGYASPLKVG